MTVSFGQIIKTTGTFYHMYDVKAKHNFFTWGGLSWAELDAYRVIQQIWTISEHQCMDSPCRDSANVQYVQYLNKRQATL